MGSTGVTAASSVLLALALVRQKLKAQKGRSICGDGRIRRALGVALPFELTSSQQQALAEIEADMAAPYRMLRLLQGDVGSGKTAVALFAISSTVGIRPNRCSRSCMIL